MNAINKWFDLSNRNCIVTGANGLLGNACAEALSECGAKVIAVDISFSRAISGEKVELDLAEEKAVGDFFQGLKGSLAGGREWSLINCAYPRTKNWGTLNFDNVTMEDWNQNVSMHLGSAFFSTQKAVDLMKDAGGGSIINFGSIYGMNGPDMSLYAGTKMVNPAPYAAIKSGIMGLSRYVATTCGEYNVRANVISPGGIEDAQAESFKETYKSRTPLKRMGTPEDIVGAVLYLVGPAAKYITGTNLVVDGGWTAW